MISFLDPICYNNKYFCTIAVYIYKIYVDKNIRLNSCFFEYG